jgi:4-hydroxyphenylpyruvate dioxygenase
MGDFFENPIGVTGIEFVEFASLKRGMLEPVFEALGFAKVAVHRSKDMALHRQGDINFIVNYEPDSTAAYFAAEDGPSACGIAFRVADADVAYARALELGAAPMEIETAPVALRAPVLQGIGGVPLYLVDGTGGGTSIYGTDFEFNANVEQYPAGRGLQAIDHLAHHVHGGGLSYWAVLYASLFGSGKVRCSDIRDQYVDPAGAMPSSAEGVRHIALLADNLAEATDRLRAAGVALMAAPGDEPAAFPERGPRMVSTARLGPVSFEFIQRKGGAEAEVPELSGGARVRFRGKMVHQEPACG